MIVQGSNAPIKIKFQDAVSVSNITDISVALCAHSSTAVHSTASIIKRWGKSDLTFNATENSVTAPITQEESMNWTPQTASLEIKFLVSGSTTVVTASLASITIVARCDEKILGGGN